MKQYCPQCVLELNKQNKKLGHLSVWMVCPKCGHRERPISESSIKRNSAFESDRIKQRNKNLNQFNFETEKGI